MGGKSDVRCAEASLRKVTRSPSSVGNVEDCGIMDGRAPHQTRRVFRTLETMMGVGSAA